MKTADGEKTASCSVTVWQAAPFTGAVTFDKDTVKTGEPVTATWSLSGGVPPYSVSAYSWYVREEGSGTKILEKSGGAAAVGSLSFTPTKGEALMLELDLRDSADRIFSVFLGLDPDQWRRVTGYRGQRRRERGQFSRHPGPRLHHQLYRVGHSAQVHGGR
ncbi:MAG: hypothetical protein ACOX62_09760 [Christensenellales bacterium]